jgi:hypothetical protein
MDSPFGLSAWLFPPTALGFQDGTCLNNLVFLVTNIVSNDIRANMGPLGIHKPVSTDVLCAPQDAFCSSIKTSRANIHPFHGLVVDGEGVCITTKRLYPPASPTIWTCCTSGPE